MKTLYEIYMNNLFPTPTIDEFTKRNKEIDEMEMAHAEMEKEGCRCRKCNTETTCEHSEEESHEESLCGICAS